MENNSFFDIFKVGEEWLSKYRNLIGIGVITFLVIFSYVFISSIQEQREIAESCGFDDGKLKCVCTDSAWEEKMNGEINFSGNVIFANESIDLNSGRT